MARERIAFQGLPARICWVGLGDRHRLGLAFNEMVRSGELKAPVVIGRDHLDSGSVASPNRETEAMRDGSDAVSDWPLLNALLNTRIGRDLGVAASRRRRRHGVFAACRHGDRLPTAPPMPTAGIARVLWNDPATGVMRHADAGYDDRARLRPRQRAAAAGDSPGLSRPAPADRTRACIGVPPGIASRAAPVGADHHPAKSRPARRCRRP